jgi:type II secretory pathway component PulC
MWGIRLIGWVGIAALLFVPACQKQEGGGKAKAGKTPAAAAKAPPTAVPPTATPTVEPTPEPTPVPPTPEPEAEAEEAPGDLRLLGIVHGTAAAPSALIGYQDKQDIFREGEAVFGQGTLKDVRKDDVIIQTSDGPLTLKVAKETAPAEAAPERAEVVEAPPTVSEPAPPPVSASVPRAEAREALKNFGSLLKKADAHPAPEGAKGIQLDKVEATSFLAKLGLRSGDMVQKINGIALSDPEKLPDLSGTAEGAEISITLMRGEVGFTYSRKLQ